VLTGERDGTAAAREADLLGDLGDRADVEELVLVRVMPMLGKTTVSSRGMSRRRGLGAAGAMVGLSTGGIGNRSI